MHNAHACRFCNRCSKRKLALQRSLQAKIDIDKKAIAQRHRHAQKLDVRAKRRRMLCRSGHLHNYIRFLL